MPQCRGAAYGSAAKNSAFRAALPGCSIPAKYFCRSAGVPHTAVRQKMPHSVPHCRGVQSRQNIFAAVPGCRMRQCGKKCHISFPTAVVLNPGKIITAAVPVIHMRQCCKKCCIPCRFACVSYTAVRCGKKCRIAGVFNPGKIFMPQCRVVAFGSPAKIAAFFAALSGSLIPAK